MTSGTPAGFIVTGTDTGIGKTVFAAALAAALDGFYWKPIQAGLGGETDDEAVRRLGRLAVDRVVPSAHRLKLPAAPLIAASAEGIDIRQRSLELPLGVRPLIVEGAGGVMVPISSRLLQADLFGFWGLPVVVCARTTLGTINHTLLSLEALRRRRVPVHGVAFIGAAEPAAEDAIATFGGVRLLGRLPMLDPLTPDALTAAFATGFEVRDFAS